MALGGAARAHRPPRRSSASRLLRRALAARGLWPIGVAASSRPHIAASRGANAQAAASGPTTAPAPAGTTAAPQAARRRKARGRAAAAPAGQPKRGGNLRIGVAGDVARLDGQLYSSINTTWIAFDRLTPYDDKLKPQPMLAESWDAQQRLQADQAQPAQGRPVPHRPRVHQRGRQVQRPAGPRPQGRRRRPASSRATGSPTIETPDKYTVVLTSEQPRPAMFDFFEYFNIVDQDTIEGAERKTKTGRHRAVHAGRVGAGRPPDASPRTRTTGRTDLPYLDAIQVNIRARPAVAWSRTRGGRARRRATRRRSRLRAPEDRPKIPRVDGARPVPMCFGSNATKAADGQQAGAPGTATTPSTASASSTIAFRGSASRSSLPWQPDSLAYDAATSRTSIL